MESMANRLQNHPISNNRSRDDLTNDLKALVNNTFNHFKQAEKENIELFNDSDLEILKLLKKDENIIICKPNKGRGVVILNREDYISKMN